MEAYEWKWRENSLFSYLERPKIGDRLHRSMDGMPIGSHYGSYAGTDYIGRPLVQENTKGVGVRVVFLEDFAKGSPVYVDPIPEWEGLAASRRMEAILAAGKKYDVWDNNCEHMANEVATGEPRSDQVTNVVLAFVAVVALRVLIEPKALRKALAR